MRSELKPVHCGCGGEAKVVKHEYYMCSPTYGVTCYKCGTATNQGFDTEAEAIEAWNTAMGTNARTLMKVFAHDATCAVCGKNKERAAKVENQYTVGDNGKIYEYGLCEECGAPVIKPDKYCSECGAKLEWGGE